MKKLNSFSRILFSIIFHFTCGRRIEYAHHFPACRMKRLRLSGWQRVYGVGLRRPSVQPLQSMLKRPGCWWKMLPLFANPLRPFPTEPLFFHMVQHLADWVIPFLRSQYSPPPPPFEFFPSVLSLHLPPPTCTGVKGNHNDFFNYNICIHIINI